MRISTLLFRHAEFILRQAQDGGRRRTILSLAVIFFLLGFTIFNFNPFSQISNIRTKAQVGPANDEIHYSIISPEAVTIDWRGPDNTIRYGTTTSYGQSAAAINPVPLPFSSAGPFWEARLTNLTPNTLYHYSIGADPDHTFKTPPLNGTPGFTVEAIADIGDTTSYANVGPIAQMIAADAPDLVLIPGDLTYGNNHGQTAVDQHFNDLMVWSGNATAYMPAWGNHEWDETTDDLRNYKGRFDFPNPQTSATCNMPSLPNNCGGEDWYWFDYGNTRFIAYPEPYSSSSTTWGGWNTKATILMDQAQADPNINFIVTFGHRPAYSSGHHPGSTTLGNFLNTLGASHSEYVLNLNGHSHNYERTYPQNGVTHITVGTGGASLEQDGSCLWFTCTQPSWSAVRYMRQGVTKLLFSQTSIQGYFLCGPPGGGTNDINCNVGDVIDSFSIGAPLPTSTPTPTPTPASATISTRVSSSSDDAEQLVSNGSMRSLTSSDLELTYDGGTQTVGMRFTNLNIPTGAAITNSYIEFTAKETQPDVTNITFYGEAVDNSTTFNTSTGNISNRAKTTSFVSWNNIPVWTVGVKYATPSLSSVIQEIVSRTSWVSGSALSIIVTGTGHRTAYSYDGSSSLAAKLVVAYSTESTPTPTLTPTPTVTPTPSVTPTVTSSPTPSPLPSTLTFIPTDDATIRGSKPNNNYGSASKLEVDNNPLENTLIKFTVSGVAERQVISAKLRLYNVGSSNKGGDFYRVLNNNWSEKIVTWNNAPLADTLVSSLGNVAPNTWYEVDLSSYIRGDGVYSLRIVSTSSDGADYSSEESANDPKLVLTLN